MKNLPNWIEVSIFGFLFVLPWQTRLMFERQLNGGYWEYGSVSLYATEFLLWAILFGLGVWVVRQPRPVGGWVRFGQVVRTSLSAKIYIGLVGLVVLAGLSIGWALLPQLALAAWFRFTEVVAFAVVIVLIPTPRWKLGAAFVGGSLLQSLFGIWQFFVQYVPAQKWLGLALHTPVLGGSIVLESMDERWLRAYGALPHPNMLGGLLALAVIIVVWFGIHATSTLARRFVLTAHVVLVPGLFFTFSRSAWLGLGCALVVAAAWVWQWGTREQRRAFGIQLGVIGLMTAVLVGLLYAPVSARLHPNQRLELDSLRLRLTFTQQAWEVFSASFPWGVGLGNYTAGVYSFVNSSWPFWYYQPVHHLGLLILAELGVLGFGLALALGGGILVGLWRKRSRSEVTLALALSVCLGVVSCFDHYLWTLYTGQLLGFGVVGFAIWALRQSEV